MATYNTLEELIDALKASVFPNDSFLTGPAEIQQNDVDLAETLWNKLVQNAQVGTQDPNDNVTPDVVGRMYIKEDAIPEQVYISSVAGDDTSWLLLNDLVASGNGVTKNANGTLGLGNITEDTTIDCGDKTITYGNILQLLYTVGNATVNVQSSSASLGISSGSDVSSIGVDTGQSTMSVLNTGTGESGGVIVTSTNTKQSTTDSSGKEFSIETTTSGVIVRDDTFKGLLASAAQSNTNWLTDDLRYATVGLIKSNVSNLISGHTSVASVVANPVLSNMYIPYSISLSSDHASRITMSLDGVPSTSEYAYTYEVDIVAVGTDTNKHVIVDFTGNVGCPKIKLNGTFDKILSQNAAYIISYDGLDLVYDRIEEPSILVTDQANPSYTIGPGKWLVTGSFTAATLEDTSNVIEGEVIEITTSNNIDMGNATFTTSGGDSINAIAFNSGTNKVKFVNKGTKWYKYN